MMQVMGFILILVLIALAIMKFNLTLVKGRSMLPTFTEDDIIKTRRVLHPFEKPIVGRIYLYHPPREDIMVVKRLCAVRHYDGLTVCYFLGDNASESLDSRAYGWIDWNDVKTICTGKIKL